MPPLHAIQCFHQVSVPSWEWYFNWNNFFLLHSFTCNQLGPSTYCICCISGAASAERDERGSGDGWEEGNERRGTRGEFVMFPGIICGGCRAPSALHSRTVSRYLHFSSVFPFYASYLRALVVTFQSETSHKNMTPFSVYEVVIISSTLTNNNSNIKVPLSY